MVNTPQKSEVANVVKINTMVNRKDGHRKFLTNALPHGKVKKTQIDANLHNPKSAFFNLWFATQI